MNSIQEAFYVQEQHETSISCGKIAHKFKNRNIPEDRHIKQRVILLIINNTFILCTCLVTIFINIRPDYLCSCLCPVQSQ
jgi:hypothetical protein